MKRLLVFGIVILSCLSVSAQKDTAAIKFANVTPADFEPSDIAEPEVDIFRCFSR